MALVTRILVYIYSRLIFNTAMHSRISIIYYTQLMKFGLRNSTINFSYF